MKFIDQVRVRGKAGDGGSGCCSFRREKFVPKGGPDGGDGGRGGDIILRADVNVDTLTALYHDPMIEARRGGNGSGARKTGRAAQPVIVPVPVGTLVYAVEAPHAADVAALVAAETDADAGDEPNGAAHEEVPKPKARLTTRGLEPLADLAEPGQEFILCHGGDGGRGNIHFKSSRNRVPTQFTKGDPGVEGWFMLELRTIADAGLVGYPNAGKSTLLGAISAAKPKAAPYPFTTLHPLVGVVELPEYRRMTVADIPGLIEGAHRNVGLGHEFLRHIVRCRTLVFVVDTAGSEERDPVEDIRHLRRELDLYDKALPRKPWFIAANKMDLPSSAENFRRLQEAFPKVTTLPISAEDRSGLDSLVHALEERVFTA